MKIAKTIAFAVLLAAVPQSVKVQAEDEKIAIIHTNDTRGNVSYEKAQKDREASLGYAAVSYMRNELIEEGYEVLLLDAGNTLFGTEYVNYAKGANAIELMNAAGYDAMAPGELEFIWGSLELEKNIQTASFPVLAANVFSDQSGELFAQDRVVLTLESGTKVGIFGLVSPYVKKTGNPKNTGSLRILEAEDLYRCAQEQVDALSDECDLIICLGNLGENEDDYPNRSIDVAENTDGIDLWIDGLSDDGRDSFEIAGQAGENSPLIVRARENFEEIGIILLEKNEVSIRCVSASDYDFANQDENITALISEKEDLIEEELNSVIGESLVNLDAEKSIRKEENGFGNLVADAILWKAQQATEESMDAAFVCADTFLTSIEKGDLTKKLIQESLLKPDHILTVCMPGQKLLEILEAAYAALPEENAAFLQISGIKCRIDLSIPAGGRVSIETVGSEDFEPQKEYRIAFDSHMIKPQENQMMGIYDILLDPYDKTGADTGIALSDALTDYVTENLRGLIDGSYENPAGNIEIIEGKDAL